MRPAVATGVLAVLVSVAVGGSLWRATAGDAWERFEDRHGPVQVIAAFSIALPLAALARRRRRLAAWWMLVLGIAPPMVGSFGNGRPAVESAIALVTSPISLYAATLLLSPSRTPEDDRPPKVR